MEKPDKFDIGENEASKERYVSKINLHFFRHGEKEKDPSKNDTDIELTETGKKQALGKSNLKNINQAVAFGSPRLRTQETAGFAMAGRQKDITGEESLNELKKKVDKNLQVGTKITKDKRLDFRIDYSGEYGKELIASEKKGEFLKFLVETSDVLAQKVGDAKSTTYSRAAASIAGIVLKYLKIAPRFNELIKDGKNQHENTMDRFFGSHQGITESFLAKVIEKSNSKEERDKFVQALNNQGFGFTEGFDMEILNQESKDPKIRFSYKKEKEGKIVFEFNEYIPKFLIENIASEYI